MNCPEVRALLPLLVYGDLQPQAQTAVTQHLQECAACQRDQASLERTRRLLGAVPTPRGRVDLGKLYRENALRQDRRLRRWRRLALFVSAAAAGLLVCVVGLRLQAKVENHQFVLRWGAEPPPPQPIPDAEAMAQPLAVARDALRSKAVEEKLELLTALIHALADDMQGLERRQRQETIETRGQLLEFERQSNQRLAVLERTADALYALYQKGE